MHNKLYHLGTSDYEEFASVVCAARAAFHITPEGHTQFKEWLQSIKRYSTWCTFYLSSKISTRAVINSVITRQIFTCKCRSNSCNKELWAQINAALQQNGKWQRAEPNVAYSPSFSSSTTNESRDTAITASLPSPAIQVRVRSRVVVISNNRPCQALSTGKANAALPAVARSSNSTSCWVANLSHRRQANLA